MRLTPLVLSVVAAVASAQADEPPPPNIVLLYADDLGYGDLGCYGSSTAHTPHLDRMAEEGTKLRSFYVAQAVCSASRTALLTGCYPNRLGILGALGPKAEHGIAAGETTLAELLRARGYATAAYGKWHLGHHEPFLPDRHGFDDYFGLPYSNDMGPLHPLSHSYPDLPLIEGHRTIALNPDQSQLTRQYTDRAVSFMHDHRAGPFFVYLPYTMPHVPLFASAAFAGKSGKGLYADSVAEIDGSVGRILKTLKELGLDDRTLVLFASDNGPWLSYGDHAGSSGGLREGKATTFEGGVRVPCLVRWPGHVRAGAVSDEPIMTIDVLPTIAGLVGAPVPSGIDGLNAWSVLSGRPEAKSPHEALFFYWGEALQAVRRGSWKLHMAHAYEALEQPGQDGKPGRYRTQQIGLSLFDLASDPNESTNVAEQHPDVVRQLLRDAEGARGVLGDSATRRKGSGTRPPGHL